MSYEGLNQRLIGLIQNQRRRLSILVHPPWTIKIKQEWKTMSILLFLAKKNEHTFVVLK